MHRFIHSLSFLFTYSLTHALTLSLSSPCFLPQAEVAWFPRACEPVFELLLWLTRAGHTQDTASGQPSLPTLARQVLSLPDHENIPEAVSSFDALLSQLQLALERPLSLNGTRCPVDPAKVKMSKGHGMEGQL